MKSSSVQSFPTILFLSALLFSMISMGISLTSDAGVKHTETGNQVLIASDRQTGTVKV